MDWHTAPDRCTLEEGVRRSTFPLPSRALTTLHIITPYPIRHILPVSEYHAGAGKANWESENVTRTRYFRRGLPPAMSASFSRTHPTSKFSIIRREREALAQKRICPHQIWQPREQAVLLLPHCRVSTRRRPRNETRSSQRRADTVDKATRHCDEIDRCRRPRRYAARS
ncbi:hypothetical protein BV22DRAFT_912276 [Leucogyrophana mollusca]|uniref:Uncharacterized protein n=1 Tax=Leucogyrophana mollusca TaxID=85980 RepID=A0ACB8AZI3_9AGAM|nr:hypothetical protein BV22DRAFT_912276 [Leucogyrophana mollusca]